ncbi:MAG: Crp/Fnr family transcriptional regulator, partial [Hyphomicrobiales bacterium]
YDARALDRTRVIAMDGLCLRNKCEADHNLGYDIMKRLMPIEIDRLHTTRIQFLDLYNSH